MGQSQVGRTTCSGGVWSTDVQGGSHCLKCEASQSQAKQGLLALGCVQSMKSCIRHEIQVGPESQGQAHVGKAGSLGKVCRD